MIQKHVLPNGLTLLTESMPNIRSVSLGVWLKQGSRHESEDENGISHFIEHLLFKGTARRTAQEIAKTIDRMGGQCDAFTSKEFTCFYSRSLDEHVPVAFDLLSDIVLNPRFLPEQIEKERQVIFEEIKMVEDSPDELVFDLFTETLWRGHPLGRPIQGTVESVAALGAETLTGFFRGAYTPGNVLVSAAGNLDHDQMADLATRAFSGMPPGNGTRPVSPPSPRAEIVTREKKELEQLHLALGVPAFPHDHPDRYCGYVLNTILGGAMSSRLFQKVREDRGLAYTVYSSISSFADTGFLAVYAATRPEGARELVESVCEELREVKGRPVDASELAGAKDHLKGNLMLSLESSSARMSNLARQFIYFGRQYELDEIVQGIEAVTAEAVQALAREILDGRRATLAALGRLDGLKISASDIAF
ncbi:MAG TPA: pitrilysin family protein [Candidatus Saccharimonadales bacterium]|nr:pitrilysin family protein [Candidatus Saccharimonadales bacterium]